MKLRPKQVSYLRGLAHKINPLVQVGKAGFTGAIVKEVDRNLADHELIKVRVGAEDREEFLTVANEMATATRATLVQNIGRVVVLYRPAVEPVITLP